MILLDLMSASVSLVKNKTLMREVKGKESVQDKIQSEFRDVQVFTGVCAGRVSQSVEINMCSRSGVFRVCVVCD